MNIAFLSFFNGLHFRGVETFVHELATRLSTNHKVVVYQNGKALTKTAYQVKYLPSQSSLPDFDPLPEVIIPVNGRIQAILCKYWALTHKAKVIISGQSGPGFDDRLNLYTFPDAFVSMTDYQLQWAKKTNPYLKKNVKISNGVDLNLFHSGNKPYSFNLPHPVILYVAALEPIKRHHLLIQALANIPQASLLLVGRGSLENEINAQATQVLGKKRYQIQFFPLSQMPFVYPAADLFVYPTAPWESFGIAILEAMASGLPVVATDDPIRQEIIGDGGVLADPTDPSKFAKAIETALGTKWNKKPVDQAKKFSWDAVSDKYLDLCKSL